MKLRQQLPARSLLRGSTVAAIVLAGYAACAHPYASGVTNNAGTISFILNESADSVQVAFDNYTSTNNLGALAAGVQSFALAGHTNYAIIVRKAGIGVPFLISADTNRLLNFPGPEGVAVNRNPKTSNFGRIYVVNSNPDIVTVKNTSDTRTCGQGVYLLNADQSDAVGQGDTALTAGLPVDNNVASAYVYVPYKISVGPDDMVYIGDGRSLIANTTVNPYRNEAGSGVWMAAPDFSTGQDLFIWGSSTEFGGVSGRPLVTGSLAGGDLVLYALEYDKTPYQTVWKYNIGAGPLPYDTLPTAVCNAGYTTVNTVQADMSLGPDGTLYTMQYRGTPGSDGDTGGTGIPMRIWSATNNSVQIWNSYNALGVNGLDPFAYCHSLDISPDGQRMVTANGALGQIEVMKLTNGIPDISTFTCVDNGFSALNRSGWSASIRSLAYDAAENIYAGSLGSGLVRVYSPGQATTCITANDWTGTNGTFSITKSDLSPRAFVTAPQDPNLDLTGNLVVAEYYGGQYGILPIGGVPFVQNNARVGGNVSSVLNPLPNFGASQDAINLAKISQSDNWQPNFNFTVPCTAGHSYKLQLLFHDNYYSVLGKRRFNVTVGGTNLASCLDLALLGAYKGNAKDVVLTYSFTNTDGSPLPIALGQVTDNPMISALILKDTTPGLTVLPIIITANPQSQTNYAGRTVSFQAAALGTTPSYQWQAGAIGSGVYTNLINGGRYSGVTSPTLTIANAKLSDQLDYVLVASNSAGSVVSSPATLTVAPLGGVATVATPADLGLASGTVVAAEYYGANIGPLTIGGTVFHNNNTRVSPANFTGALNTPNFGASADAGNLALISAADASNPSFDFTVPTVAGRNYLLKLLFHDNSFNSVGARVFQVNAGLQSGPLGQVGPQIDLVQLGAYQTQPADLLLTLGVTNSDGSPIQIQLSSIVQNPMISALILQDVSSGTVPPMITIQPEPSVSLYSGHSTNLFAVVAGTSLLYQWQVSTDGVTWNNLTDSSGNISGSTTSTLTLVANASVPYAQYRLVAQNSAGSVTTAAAAVTVNIGPPQILTGGDLPAAQAIRVGQTLNLSVAVDGDAPFAFHWQSSLDGGATWNPVANGGRISGATSNVLTILNAQTNDSAMYQLSITNDQSFGSPIMSAMDTVSVLNGAASFNTNGIGWTLNGGGSIVSNVFSLSDGSAGENRSGFFNVPLYVGAFQAKFTYQNHTGGGGADGITFMLQNDSSGTAYLGTGGGGLGYSGPAGPSFALCFDIYQYASEPRGAPGYTFCTNGVAPAAIINPIRDTSPVSLVNTVPIDVSLLYFNGQLTLTMIDTLGNSFTKVINSINLPAMLNANTAYVGFAGGDGGIASWQDVSNFSFEPLLNLSCQLTGTNTALLTWEKNSGFVLESTSDVASGTWQKVPAGNVAGQAVVPVTPDKQFYRLASPLR
jgi:hypothetical protein